MSPDLALLQPHIVGAQASWLVATISANSSGFSPDLVLTHTPLTHSFIFYFFVERTTLFIPLLWFINSVCPGHNGAFVVDCCQRERILKLSESAVIVCIDRWAA